MTRHLYVDEGNTRLKAWLTEGARVLAYHVAADAEALMAILMSAEHGLALPGIQVHVASVRHDLGHQAWQRLCRLHGMSCHPVRVSADVLPTCYAQPERLGIDRWLAVLAISGRRRPALVLDAGTAVTLDVFVPGQGHVGGYILPGLRAQQAALAQMTARVSFPVPDWRDANLGTDTASCVGHGSLRALLALAGDVLSELRAQHGEADLWLTGGDAEYLSPGLPGAAHVPYLVLAGMAACAGDSDLHEGLL